MAVFMTAMLPPVRAAECFHKHDFRAPQSLVGNPGQDERDSGMIPNGFPG